MEILLIGYGNTLRRDDGLGPRVVEQLEKMAVAGVRCMVIQQLLPELAEPISRAEAAIFVDASIHSESVLRLREAAPDPAARIATHASDPGALLALARALFGRCPKAWTLQLPGADFELGEELSPMGQSQIEPAIRMLLDHFEELKRKSKGQLGKGRS